MHNTVYYDDKLNNTICILNCDMITVVEACHSFCIKHVKQILKVQSHSLLDENLKALISLMSCICISKVLKMLLNRPHEEVCFFFSVYFVPGTKEAEPNKVNARGDFAYANKFCGDFTLMNCILAKKDLCIN